MEMTVLGVSWNRLLKNARVFWEGEWCAVGLSLLGRLLEIRDPILVKEGITTEHINPTDKMKVGSVLAVFRLGETLMKWVIPTEKGQFTAKFQRSIRALGYVLHFGHRYFSVWNDAEKPAADNREIFAQLLKEFVEWQENVVLSSYAVPSAASAESSDFLTRHQQRLANLASVSHSYTACDIFEEHNSLPGYMKKSVFTAPCFTAIVLSLRNMLLFLDDSVLNVGFLLATVVTTSINENQFSIVRSKILFPSLFEYALCMQRAFYELVLRGCPERGFSLPSDCVSANKYYLNQTAVSFDEQAVEDLMVHDKVEEEAAKEYHSSQAEYGQELALLMKRKKRCITIRAATCASGAGAEHCNENEEEVGQPEGAQRQLTRCPEDDPKADDIACDKQCTTAVQSVTVLINHMCSKHEHTRHSAAAKLVENYGMCILRSIGKLSISRQSGFTCPICNLKAYKNLSAYFYNHIEKCVFSKVSGNSDADAKRREELVERAETVIVGYLIESPELSVQDTVENSTPTDSTGNTDDHDIIAPTDSAGNTEDHIADMEVVEEQQTASTDPNENTHVQIAVMDLVEEQQVDMEQLLRDEVEKQANGQHALAVHAIADRRTGMVVVFWDAEHGGYAIRWEDGGQAHLLQVAFVVTVLAVDDDGNWTGVAQAEKQWFVRPPPGCRISDHVRERVLDRRTIEAAFKAELGWADVVPEILSWLDEQRAHPTDPMVLVAHNSRASDERILFANSVYHGVEFRLPRMCFLDSKDLVQFWRNSTTAAAARYRQKVGNKWSVKELTKFFDVPLHNAHDALADTRALMEVCAK